MPWPDTPQTEDGPHYFAQDQSPLLPGVSKTATVSDGDEEDPRDKFKWPVIILAFCLLFMLELSLGVCNPAWNALLEKGLCAEAHPELAQFLVAGDEDPACKDPAVQGKLAMYRGWSFTLHCLPPLLLAVPYGSLSDSWGRKPIAILAFVGLFLLTLWFEAIFYFGAPIWTFLLAPVCYIIGGGAVVGTSMLYTMLADVVPTDELTSVLFRLFAVFMVADLISSPLGGFLLSQSPWVALITGNIIMLISMVVLYFLPETLIVRQWHDAKAGRTASASSILAPQGSEDEEVPKRSRARAAIDTTREQLLRAREFILGNRRVAVLMVTAVLLTLEKFLEELLLQYATKRYGWSWSEASYFLTIKNASFIVMLTVLLPAISAFCLSRLGMRPLYKDLWLARWSCVVLILANLATAFSDTPALFAVGLVLTAGGCGLPALLRSLLNAMVEPHHVGMLNTLLGFLETVCVMVSAPVFSQALRKGIEMGGGWIGLPFVAGAGVIAVAAGVMWVYRVPGPSRGEREDGG